MFQDAIDKAIIHLKGEHVKSHQREHIEAMLRQAVNWERALRDGLPVDEMEDAA